MRVQRRGGLRLELEPVEVALLTDLLGQLVLVVAGPADPADEVLQRLYPDAYPDDPEASAEFRNLTRSTDRRDRLEECLAELAELDGRDSLDLAEGDAAQRWLQSLNDLRLALGTRLGVTADSDHDVDPTDPEQQPWVVYHWLTGMQDQLLVAIMH